MVCVCVYVCVCVCAKGQEQKRGYGLLRWLFHARAGKTLEGKAPACVRVVGFSLVLGGGNED